jgi:hypothetical protein
MMDCMVAQPVKITVAANKKASIFFMFKEMQMLFQNNA